MTLQALTPEQAKKIYHAHMVRDFPEAELKPFSAMARMQAVGGYDFWGLYTGENTLCGYAYVVRTPGTDTVLLDYLAVLPAARCGGLGTDALALLQRRYAGEMRFILIEAELPEKAPAPSLAARRLGFYTRAGAAASGVGSDVFGVEYINFALPCGGAALPDDNAVYTALETHYHFMIPPPYYENHLRFWRKGTKG